LDFGFGGCAKIPKIEKRAIIIGIGVTLIAYDGVAERKWRFWKPFLMECVPYQASILCYH
jgi:hypothetical protein